MNWFLVDKRQTEQPATGTYKQWKPQLRTEGRFQCVYCAIGEGMYGGERNFHVEHYRPRKSFSTLTNVIANLFYSCAICNAFKGSDWPEDPAEDLSNNAYPDPSSVDYASFLSVDESGVVYSNLVAGKYVLERLNLNRPQLLLARQLVKALVEITALTDVVEAAANECSDPNVMRKGMAGIGAAVRLLARLPQAIPYETADARR